MELTPHTKLSVATPVALKERKKKKRPTCPRIHSQLARLEQKPRRR